jgi:hypothetical protein
MALAIDAAVSGARAGDAVAFADASVELRHLDRGPVAVLLAALTRDVLERAHPDGLDSDDAEQALQSCIRSAVTWYSPLDSDALVRALTGALGVSEPDEEQAVDELAVLDHGLLLIADQLTSLGQALPPILDAALGELMRAQTVELP